MNAPPDRLRPGPRPLVSVSVMANPTLAAISPRRSPPVRQEPTRDLELVVSDDGSRDDSVAIVEMAMAEEIRGSAWCEAKQAAARRRRAIVRCAGARSMDRRDRQRTT